MIPPKRSTTRSSPVRIRIPRPNGRRRTRRRKKPNAANRGAHGDDNPVGVGCAIIVEELVVGAQLGVDLAHVLLHDLGEGVIVLVGGLAVLEEDVAVLVGAAHHGALGVEGALAEGKANKARLLKFRCQVPAAKFFLYLY